MNRLTKNFPKKRFAIETKPVYSASPMSKHRSSEYSKQLDIAILLGCEVTKSNNKYIILAPDGKTIYHGHNGEAGVCKLKSFNRKVKKMVDTNPNK
jgi:ABC-type uncharacterized transport system permease subunit